MKRSPMPKRKARLRARTPMKRGTKPLAKRGATKAKKEARYKAYLSSPAWKAKRKEALERAGHRCEYVARTMVMRFVDYIGEYAVRHDRCTETTRLHVHHKSYARFGDEHPDDLQVLCKAHHDYVERTQYPHRRGAA